MPPGTWPGIGDGDGRRNARRMLGDRGVFGLIVLAPLVYGLLYPAALSRPAAARHTRSRSSIRTIPSSAANFVQTSNADEAIEVAVARTRWPRRRPRSIDGRCLPSSEFPQDTEREVLKGNPARLRGLCRFGLFPALQPHAAGDLGSERSGQRRHRLRAARAPTAVSPTRR